jgi:hypothetical protein
MKHSDQYHNLRRKLSRLVFSILAASIMLTTASIARAETQQLPISDFLNLLTPTASQAWQDPITGDLIRFDTYGKLNSLYNFNLNTTVTGKYTVRILTDGTQQVSVNIQTRNALCYGFNVNNEILFGYSRLELLNGLGPAALGSGTTRLEYAPQPSGSFNPNGELETIFTTIKCDGLLRAPSGFPEGTPGFAQTTQTGLFNTGVPTGCPLEGDADCFPAEKVQFKPVGQQ